MVDRRLGVWLHGALVAEIISKGPGRITCRYTTEAQEEWPGGTPPPSCSLPVSSKRYRDAGAWFQGLLPEGRALQAMADRARVPTYYTFGMLARFGRDSLARRTDPEVHGAGEDTTPPMSQLAAGLTAHTHDPTPLEVDPDAPFVARLRRYSMSVLEGALARTPSGRYRVLPSRALDSHQHQGHLHVAAVERGALLHLATVMIGAGPALDSQTWRSSEIVAPSPQAGDSGRTTGAVQLTRSATSAT